MSVSGSPATRGGAPLTSQAQHQQQSPVVGQTRTLAAGSVLSGGTTLSSMTARKFEEVEAGEIFDCDRMGLIYLILNLQEHLPDQEKGRSLELTASKAMTTFNRQQFRTRVLPGSVPAVEDAKKVGLARLSIGKIHTLSPAQINSLVMCNAGTSDLFAILTDAQLHSPALDLTRVLNKIDVTPRTLAPGARSRGKSNADSFDFSNFSMFSYWNTQRIKNAPQEVLERWAQHCPELITPYLPLSFFENLGTIEAQDPQVYAHLFFSSDIRGETSFERLKAVKNNSDLMAILFAHFGKDFLVFDRETVLSQEQMNTLIGEYLAEDPNSCVSSLIPDAAIKNYSASRLASTDLKPGDDVTDFKFLFFNSSLDSQERRRRRAMAFTDPNTAAIVKALEANPPKSSGTGKERRYIFQPQSA